MREYVYEVSGYDLSVKLLRDIQPNAAGYYIVCVELR